MVDLWQGDQCMLLIMGTLNLHMVVILDISIVLILLGLKGDEKFHESRLFANNLVQHVGTC